MKNKILYIFLLGCITMSYSQDILPIGDNECESGQPASRYFQDTDGDGAGNPDVFVDLCSPPGAGWVIFDDSDCDDDDPDIQGEKNWYLDNDGDGYGSSTGTVQRSCTNPSTSTIKYVDNNTDCDDGNPNVSGKTAYYLDGDKDGKAAINATARYGCSNPSTATVKYVTAQHRTDCDDTDPNTISITWYRDEDGDGFGEAVVTRTQCDRPGNNYYRTNNDQCPGIGGRDNGCPEAGSNVAELWNTVKVIDYDVTEKEIARSKSYFDELGKSVQTQTRDFKTGKTWAAQTMYDKQGRPALQTLPAPTHVGTPLEFLYKEDFVLKSNGTALQTQDFENNLENPATVGSQVNTVGRYYSTGNTDEPYQDVTDRPYARTIYSELNPGTPLRTIGGNKMGGEWKNGYVFSMPAGRELAENIAFGDTKYYNYKVTKTVSRDVHGTESVVFTDTDGKVLAAARSGNEEGGKPSRISVVPIGDQRFVDIHIPVGLSGITVRDYQGRILNNDSRFEVYDLITEQKITTAFGSLPHGFYRVAIVDGSTTNYTINYPENYYDYTLNEYDRAGRLIASYQPLAKQKSEFEYNALGQLIYTKSPDEGEAWFKYRRDGQIRFSQNSKQKAAGEFSYTNYDNLGRPIESGVLVSNAFVTSNPDNVLPAGARKEQHSTTYDAISTADFNALPTNYKNPLFLAGNVSKTWNENTTTYYSYDIYGRVLWIVQDIVGLGIKTIDYEYDAITSQVTKVYYQKGSRTEEFIHRYSYDPIDYNLTKVETSAGGRPYVEHAAYEYYETGALKRLNLANGLQGIDYVYNLQGALKSINHPNLNAASDPGGDSNDLFGMNMHYYQNDYQRTNTPKPVNTTTNGIEQYNGNIKALTWNTKNQNNNSPDTYYYTYNKENWLTGASFNQNVNEANPNLQENETRNQPITTSETVEARKSVSLLPGFSFVGASNRVFVGKIARDGSVSGNGDYNVYDITYDANGNIQTLNRNKNTASGSNAMDQLSYVYKTDKPNQLLRVDDTAGDVSGADDIGDQNGNNYVYNEIGQLVQNNQDNISYIYNASGLVTEIKKGNQTLVKFFYNDKNHRVKKESYNPTNGSLTYSEHYIRDAAGTAMAIYRNGQVIENTIYGNGRLGVRKSDGSHLYQLTDHLGNVRAVVGRNAAGQAMALTSATDYYPFGMPMPDRNVEGDYRYGYQGEFAETDKETGMPAFELRLWDARIGRWLTVDPYSQYHSPYMGMDNNPITSVDPTGGCTSCAECPEACGELGIDSVPEGQGIWSGENGFSLGALFDSNYSLLTTVDIFAQRKPGAPDNPIDTSPIDRAFNKGFWLKKLWDQYGYFEIGANAIKGKAFEVKINKAYHVEIAPNKQIPWSWSYNNRDDKVVETYGVENHPTSWNLGAGFEGGMSMSLARNPDGTKDVTLGVGYKALAAETVMDVVKKTETQKHPFKHNSTFIGLDFTPGIGLFYGVEGTFRIGFLID